MGEEELIRQCMRGVNAARKELYDTYAKQMLSICYRYTGGMDVAYDLLHDGFLKVFSSCSGFTYRGEGSLKAWMSRIFVNTALEYLRKKDVLKQIPTSVLMQFVQELPTGYRTVFNLYTFEERSHKEIAELLHINERSSSSQLCRAKAMLVKKVNDYIQKEAGR